MMDATSDKLSIKNLLFTKAIPNHVIPTPVNGHRVYACIECGDKFIFESSYNDHVNRKSAKITYMCRHCNILRVFYNRCNFLFHIRAHAFKTATINVTDLKVEPLPVNYFKMKPTEPKASTSGLRQAIAPEPIRKPTASTVSCFECKENITVTSIAYKDRANHFMQYTNEVYACPVCLFALPSICALKVHLRLHLKCPPYYCPECGIHLVIKNVQYPYNHDCEGFKMMRATARLNCRVPDCSLFHPNDYKEHMRKYHLKKVYKCPFCVVACFNESTMDKHLKGHKTAAIASLFYQCNICPGRYVLQNPKQDHHLKNHIGGTVYPCWACGSTFKEVSNLLAHFIKLHNKSDTIQNALNDIFNDGQSNVSESKRIFRVIKKCAQCKRSFTYKCKQDEIEILPNECPFKCTNSMTSDVTPDKNQNIICHLCQGEVSQDWKEIKKHYAELHKAHKCLDAEILLTRVNIKKKLKPKKTTKLNTKTIQKSSKKTRNRRAYKHSTTPVRPNKLHSTHANRFSEINELYLCNMCGNSYQEKGLLEEHMITHRDPCMAYQCMECGQSFVVKPSFSKHLLLEHGIMDFEDYITNKKCYNENALMKTQNTTEIEDAPLTENQCNICREEFDGPEDLEKHFRVHGMAFLMKNTIKNNTNSS